MGTREQIDSWRNETEEKPLQSARHVQDRLLDLYGALKAYPVSHQVEEWLTLTRERTLFEGDEIRTLLDEIELNLALEAEPANS